MNIDGTEVGYNNNLEWKDICILSLKKNTSKDNVFSFVYINWYYLKTNKVKKERYLIR